MLVRPAQRSDRDTLVDFNRRMALESEGKALDLEALRQGVAAVLANPDLGHYLVGELEGQVVGQLMVTTEWSDWRNGHFWWIQSVFVLPEFRRRGVYRAMSQRVVQLAQSQGDVCGIRLYVDKDNKVAQQVYMNLGMTATNYDLLEVEFDR